MVTPDVGMANEEGVNYTVLHVFMDEYPLWPSLTTSPTDRKLG